MWPESRTAKFWLYIVLACVSFIGLAKASIELAAFALLGFIAAAIAQLFRFDLHNAFTFKRPLNWRDAAAIPLFLIAAFLMLAELIAVLGFFAAQDSSVRGLWGKRIGLLQAALWPLLALAPMIALLTRRDPVSLRGSLGSAASGIAGASIFSTGIFFIWIAFAERIVTRRYLDEGHWLSSAATFGFASVFIGFGLGLWWLGLAQALRRATRPGDIFRHTATCVIAGLILALAISAVTAFQEASQPYPNTGILLAAPLSIITGAAWIFALWRTFKIEGSAIWRVLLASVFLAILIPMSFLLPLYVAAARDWASLVVFFIAPITIALSILIAGLMPFLLRWILRRRERSVR